MIQHRPFAKLRTADHGWVKSRFHFVPAALGGNADDSYGPLIAWNDDQIAPRSGFPQHLHKNVEIVTFVLGGVLTHSDTLGNVGTAGAGELHAMSAGTGLFHTETNNGDEPVHLFQIWLQTRTLGIKPRWGMTRLSKACSKGGFEVLASGSEGDENADALAINVDARILGARMEQGETIHQTLVRGQGYLIPTRAAITVNNIKVGPRDGGLVEGEIALEIRATERTEVLFVEFI